MIKKGIVIRKMKKPAKKLPRIFTLPPELRNRIWELAVTETLNASIARPYCRTPGLTRTCRQARREALGIWILESEFRLVMLDCDITWVHESHDTSRAKIMLSAIELGVLEKASTKVYFVAHGGGPNWGNLIKSLKVFHEMRDSHCPFETGNTEVKVIVAAYGTVEAMRGNAWAEVEQRLEEWHTVLAAMDPRWT
ncbi:hypothetical protein LTR10_015655 [Elasticomyces elasticus]|nr:hypothetical protein LTR10_015655 [Elasticomyces elasticus]KAK4975511.1 hypothetical protein LTR42_004722 [Elasticomyces elasticus]